MNWRTEKTLETNNINTLRTNCGMETYDYVKKAHSDNVRTSCHIKKSNRVKLYGKVFKRQAPRGVLKSLPVVSIQSRFDRRFYTNLSGGCTQTPLYCLYGYVPLDRVWFLTSLSYTGYIISCEFNYKQGKCCAAAWNARLPRVSSILSFNTSNKMPELGLRQ